MPASRNVGRHIAAVATGTVSERRVAVERRARVDEDGARAAVLALPLLEARERAVERGLLAGLELPLPELAERALVGVACERRLLLPLLPPRVLQVRREARVAPP